MFEKVSPSRSIAIAFAAGFVATLLAHQLIVLAIGGPAYSLVATWPLGVPEFVSLAFFGGLWAIMLNELLRRMPARANGWIAWLVLGAILPTLVFWLAVVPLKGLPVSLVFSLPYVVATFVVNGAWGVASFLLIKIAGDWLGRGTSRP